MRLLRLALCGVVALSFAACQDTLVEQNTNAADRDRALATFADLEAFLGSGYTTAHNGTLAGSNDDLQTQLQVMGFENVSGLANFAMGPRGSVPRGTIDNQPGGTGDNGNTRDFSVEHRAARIASISLAALNVLSSGTPAQDARDRAFCLFVRGVALGNLALAYDSASILSETDGPEDIIPLSGYQDVMAAALRDLDSAIAIIAATPTMPALPATWINGNALTGANLVRLIRSYKARFRADVSRTPADRAAVDWAAVIADVQNGITADFIINMDPSSGWDVIWPAQAFATGSASWGQMHQFIMGMADTSGSYDAWLALPRTSRAPFVVATPDLRLPQGTSRTAQNADARAGFGQFYVSGGTNPGRPYMRNRPAGEDAPQDPFGMSFYDWWRTRGFFAASPTRTGPYPIMTRAEQHLLQAEGYLRQGQFALAIPLINETRADTLRGGLPAIPLTVADTVTQVPGGTACVPRVPDIAQSFKGTKCGNVWDALKWEYRLETAFAGYGRWYFAARGWGDLPEGTAIHWPVPNKEMLTRQQAFYGMGGVGLPGGSAKGNYGLFSGGVY
ncbi:MAG TPA: hypothetical protein VLB49_00570 [Gemmatimonadales bacterium]|nr:hypothetical protein [Gemmatimonadales bacterium]